MEEKPGRKLISIAGAAVSMLTMPRKRDALPAVSELVLESENMLGIRRHKIF